jgi:peptide/nickel transport system permease protein
MLFNDAELDIGPLQNVSRIAKYVLTRAVMLFATVAVTVYLMIIIANYGGYLDEAIKGDIDYAIGMSMKGLQGTTEERAEIFEERKAAAYEAAGLNTPFFVRCMRWLGRGLTLDWGETNLRGGADAWGAQDRSIRAAVLEHLPRSLAIFGTANLLLFLTTILVALPLTSQHPSWLDNLIILLTPLSSAPAWVYGIFLNFIFIKLMGGIFAGGTFDAWPEDLQLAHLPILLRHLLLPTLSIFLSGFFQGIYAWRTFFQLYARENYVELARAKGLRPGLLRRRYILRPLLPGLITSFVLLFVSLWQEVIVLEQFFNVAGIGQLFVTAITSHRIPVIVGVITTFAYLLAATIFLLDIIYAIVDPRIQFENQSVRVEMAKRTPWLKRLWRRLRGSDGSRVIEDVTSPTSEVPGIKVLDRVLTDFKRQDDVSLDRESASGDTCQLHADRFYPELDIAVQFEPSGITKNDAKFKRCKKTGIVLIAVPPDQPIAPATLRELKAGLSSAARRIAQSEASVHMKRTLLSRIARAKHLLKGASDSQQPSEARQGNVVCRWKERLDRLLSSAGLFVRRLSHYPAAVIGLLIILGLVGLSVYTLVTIPYPEMLQLWREGEAIWVQNPKDAAPTWVNLFRRRKLPSTVVMNSREVGSEVQVSRTVISEDMTEITLSFPFDYYYGAFPQDLAVFIDAQFDEKRPMITLNWFTPEGREIEFVSAAIGDSHTYRLSQDETLARKLGEQAPLEFLFSQPESNGAMPLSGSYEMQLNAYVFEEEADVDATFVLYGQVYGLAGTDERRRDLKVPLLWGMPVALSFGILAALGTSLSSIMIAAVGAWFGGWLDALIQRITEINMILPFLPVSIMIYVLYSKSFWVILGVTVLLSIFGNAIKNYRALFLQVREAPYVEAALSYGASNWRIIYRYLLPRIVSVLVPQLIIMVPSYVFLEATLAFLGVSDPVLPTWGKLIVSGFARGIYTANYHLVFEPLGLLMLVGFAFVMLGISLERIFSVDRFVR